MVILVKKSTRVSEHTSKDVKNYEIFHHFEILRLHH